MKREIVMDSIGGGRIDLALGRAIYHRGVAVRTLLIDSQADRLRQCGLPK